jgi:hypothetical protein
MSTNHESQSIYEEEAIKRANRHYQIDVMISTVGFGLIAGIVIGFILELGMGITGVGGPLVILGSVIGGLTGAILLYVNGKREAKSLATTQDSDAEPPESV